LLAVIVAACFLTRYWGAGCWHKLTFDEYLYAHMGCQLKENPLNYTARPIYEEQTKGGRWLPDYMTLPLYKHPPVYSYTLSLVFRCAADPTFKLAALVSVVSGTLIVVIAFLVGRKLYDERVGLLAAFFLLIDPVHWLCSEKIWLAATLAMWMWVAMLLFVMAVARGKWWLYLLAGVACGLAGLTKLPGLFFVPVGLTYATLREPRLFKQGRFWLMVSIPIAMMVPWVVWNVHVYGHDALDVRRMHVGSSEILDLAGHVVRGPWLILVVAVLGLAAAVAYLRISGRDEYMVDAFGRERATKYGAIGALAVGAVVSGTVLLHPYVLSRLMESLSFEHVPRNGWTMGMFAREPKVFYLAQLIEHSPVYVIAFLSVALLLRSGKKGDALLLVTALCILSFCALWGNYQCRYILAVVPALLIIAAGTICRAWDAAGDIRSPGASRIGRLLIGVAVGVAVLKALLVDHAIAVTNRACYF